MKPKHNYFNEVLLELYDSSYELMDQLSFINYVCGQRELRWKIKSEIDVIAAYRQNFSNSQDGHWFNVRRFAGEHPCFLQKDLKAAENTVGFLANCVDKISKLLDKTKNLKANLYGRDSHVVPWRANELVFYENMLKATSEVEIFIAKLKGDVAENLASFQRKIGRNKSTSVLQYEISHSKRRAKENKRHSIKRKEKRCRSSALLSLALLVPNEKKFLEMAKRSEFNFVISSEMIKEENLSKLKYRQHFRGIEFLLNKNVFDDKGRDIMEKEYKEMERRIASTTVTTQAKPKGTQTTIFASFAKGQ